MKKFFLKLVLFLLPFVVTLAVEAFVLPVDFSTFRAWEALKISSLKWALPGYFYPRIKVTKVEDGDQAHHTPCALKKTNYWETDRYGYRKKDSPRSVPCIVIIGDSNTAGSALTQNELLSEVLEARLNVPVYPLAPASINTLFRESRFADNPPSIVIVVSIEREITTLRQVKTHLLNLPEYKKVLFRVETALQTNPVIQSLVIPIDRALKNSLLYFTRATLRRMIEPHANSSVTCPKMFFLQGEKANKDIPAPDFQRAVDTILSYHVALRKKGIRFIFLPIPNKETIYYDLLPEGKKPVFIPRLVSALEKLGVETIDSQRLFEETRRKQGTLLYYPDDSHWNGEGVKTAAQALASLIQSRPR